MSDFVRYIKDAKNKNLKIAGYGAAAKGNTLLNFSKISNKEIDFVCDASPLKINTLLPGSHIPVHDISALSKYKPDIIIILPWNISREIVNILNNVNNWGAVYVSFIPSTINHNESSSSGSSGFIGQHVVRELIKNHNVIILTRSKNNIYDMIGLKI